MKVRLKQSLARYTFVLAEGFNSMKVRLKPVSSELQLDETEFQFHEGPIKTEDRTKYQVYSARFNSMKVRLKRRICANVLGFATLFQFHEGPIKTPASLPLVLPRLVSIP